MGFPHRVSRYANSESVHFGIFWWDWVSERFSNGQEMAAGFQESNSEPNPSHIRRFGRTLMILVSLASFPVIWELPVRGLRVLQEVLNLARSKANESRMPEACLASCTSGTFHRL